MEYSEKILLIKSCRQFRLRRETCEITWASELKRNGIPVFYVEGGYENVTLSSSKYGGLIGTPTGDDYRNNSFKLKEAIRVLLSWMYDWDYLFVCDDDTFVHPKRWMEHEPADFECLVYQLRTTKDKKLNKGRPWITGGPGWWMSRELCELYVTHCTKECSYDDVIVAKIAHEFKIKMVNRPDLYGADRYTKRNDRVSPTNKLITCHHVDVEEMLKLYEENKSDS